MSCICFFKYAHMYHITRVTLIYPTNFPHHKQQLHTTTIYITSVFTTQLLCISNSVMFKNARPVYYQPFKLLFTKNKTKNSSNYLLLIYHIIMEHMHSFNKKLEGGTI